MKIQLAKGLMLEGVALACVCGSAWAEPVGSDDVARAMGNWRHRRGTIRTTARRTKARPPRRTVRLCAGEDIRRLMVRDISNEMSPPMTRVKEMGAKK